MVNRMMEKYKGMVLLNEETVYMPRHNRVRLPLRTDEATARKIQAMIKTYQLDSFSCISSVTAKWENNKLILETRYNPRTKCIHSLYTKTRSIRTGICIEKICTGKCVDEFMRKVVAKTLLPELYTDIQR